MASLFNVLRARARCHWSVLLVRARIALALCGGGGALRRRSRGRHVTTDAVRSSSQVETVQQTEQTTEAGQGPAEESGTYPLFW